MNSKEQNRDKNIDNLVITPNLPRSTVLVFDSGVGGLSIYDEIRQVVPNLHYIYAFDNAFFPYGEKSEAFIVNRVIKIVDAVQHLYPLSMMVIACNTVSTVALLVLRKKFQFPVVGVVPAIKPATYLTKNGIIGLLATKRTIKSLYTHNLINQFTNECQIEMLGSSELVEIAEAKIHGEIVSVEDLRDILRPWINMPKQIDTVVLGCTHFPFLQKELLQVLPKETQLIDSGCAIAHRTDWILKHKALNAKSSDENIVFYMSATKKIEKLLPILNCHGFRIFRKLIL